MLPRPRLRPLPSSFASTIPHPTTTATPPRPSNTSIGTAFEHATLSFLSSPPLSLSLLRCGGSNDHGVDLRGWWEQPSEPGTSRAGRRKRWSVIVQCKAEKRKLGPGVVRELEGALGYEDWKPGKEGKGKGRSPTIAMLVSASGFSKEALLRAASSTVPLSLVSLVKEGGEGGRGMVCQGLSINPVLRELLGSALEVVRTRKVDGGAGLTSIRWAGNEGG